MVFLILGIVMGCVWWFQDDFKSHRELGRGLFEAVKGAMFGGLIGAIVVFIISIPVQGFAPKETVRIFWNEYPIVALEDGQAVHGSTSGWFLGFSGSIDSQLYYFFRERFDSGGTYIHKVSVNRIVTYEEDRDDGLVRVFKVTSQVKKGWWDYISIFSLFEITRVNSAWYDYDIYVPRGTVSHQFNSDLK